MRLALCLEQTLGHRAHANNLTTAVAEMEADVDIVSIEYDERPPIPWAFRGSWRAAQLLRHEAGAHDVRFYHTQSVSLFAPH